MERIIKQKILKRGAIKEKILLLLLGGLALGLTRSPKGYFKIVKEMQKEWKLINSRSLIRSIKSLYESKLIEQVDNRDGTVTFILSREGKEVALSYNLEEMTIIKEKWDGKWRIVMFDVPERLKKVRESLRYQLKRLGFLELQRSVFVLPYQCENELEYVIEFYDAKKYVRIVLAHSIDNELDFKQKFHLV